MSARMCITGFNLSKVQTLLSAGDSKTKDQIHKEAAKRISDDAPLRVIREALDELDKSGTPIKSLKAEKDYHSYLVNDFLVHFKQKHVISDFEWGLMGFVEFWESVVAPIADEDLGLFKYLAMGRPLLAPKFGVRDAPWYGYLTKEENKRLIRALEDTEFDEDAVADAGCDGMIDDLIESLKFIASKRKDVWSSFS